MPKKYLFVDFGCVYVVQSLMEISKLYSVITGSVPVRAGPGLKIQNRSGSGRASNFRPVEVTNAIIRLTAPALRITSVSKQLRHPMGKVKISPNRHIGEFSVGCQSWAVLSAGNVSLMISLLVCYLCVVNRLSLSSLQMCFYKHEIFLNFHFTHS